MSEEIPVTPEIEVPVEPAPPAYLYLCSRGAVVAHDGNSYLIEAPGEGLIGIPSNSTPSEANVEFDLANPAAPVVPVPSEVPAWRLHAVAEIAGLSGAIGTALSSLTGPAKIVAGAAWYQGNTIERHSATVVALGAALGLTSQALDELFIQAASLQV